MQAVDHERRKQAGIKYPSYLVTEMSKTVEESKITEMDKLYVEAKFNSMWLHR